MANRVTNDAAKVFRSECRNLPKYEKKLAVLKQDLQVVETQMVNLHSPNLDMPTTTTIGLDDRIIRNMDEKDRIVRKINLIRDMTSWITECIARLPDPSYKLFVSMIYLEGKRLGTVAVKAGVSEVRMALTITKLLNEAITPSMVRKHDRIRRSLEESGLI